jgi:hypothetical protein
MMVYFTFQQIQISDFRYLILIFSIVKYFKYTDSHEWVKVDGPLAVIGIPDHAQFGNKFSRFACVLGARSLYGLLRECRI